LRRVRRRGVSARLAGRNLLELRRFNAAFELPFRFHMGDAHEKNHVGGRFAGRSGSIGGKRKRRHHGFIDRNREGWRVRNFVSWRLRIGMNLV